MITIDGKDVPGEFEVLEGIEILTFRTKKMHPEVQKMLTELGTSSTLSSFSYCSDGEMFFSSSARITYLDSNNFYVQFMEGL